MSDYNAPVLFAPAGDWDATTVRMIWQAMRQIRPRFDFAIFDKVPDRVGDLANPLRYLVTSPYSVSGHAITLSGTFDNFEAKLPHRRSLQKATRRLCQQETPIFDIAKTPEQYDIYIEALIRQKSRQYLETWGWDGLDRPGYRQYLRKARRLVYPSGPVCLFALKVNGTIIATTWGLVAWSRFYGNMKAYEGGEWRRYSPGRILFNKIIEWCFANNLALLDCGVGDAADKEEYCDVTTTLYQVGLPVTMRWHFRQFMRNVPSRIKSLRLSK